MDQIEGKIQDAELEVMRVLWEKKAATPLIEIRNILWQRCGWEDSTVKTLLRRLMDKGAVKLEKRGVYSAVVTQDNYNRWSARTLVDKVFSGSAKNLVATLVSGGQLSEKDIEELYDMFNEGNKNE